MIIQNFLKKLPRRDGTSTEWDHAKMVASRACDFLYMFDYTVEDLNKVMVVALHHDAYEVISNTNDLELLNKNIKSVGFDIFGYMELFTRKVKDLESSDEHLQRIIDSNDLVAYCVKMGDLSVNKEYTLSEQDWYEMYFGEPVYIQIEEYEQRLNKLHDEAFKRFKRCKEVTSSLPSV